MNGDLSCFTSALSIYMTSLQLELPHLQLQPGHQSSKQVIIMMGLTIALMSLFHLW